ncbi:hypothetical protein [Bartonella sp. PS7NMGDW]|uniref:hypothetical protein n=1 Tax=Bartonella sp. PS7NMGDW TaxID=3243574 RepID=UPI0035CF6FEE
MKIASLFHLIKKITHYSKIVGYVRIDYGKNIKIPRIYGTQEFIENNKSVLVELEWLIFTQSKSRKLVEGLFTLLLKQYLNSINWYNLPKITKDKKNTFL